MGCGTCGGSGEPHDLYPPLSAVGDESEYFICPNGIDCAIFSIRMDAIDYDGNDSIMTVTLSKDRPLDEPQDVRVWLNGSVVRTHQAVDIPEGGDTFVYRVEAHPGDTTAVSLHHDLFDSNAYVEAVVPEGGGLLRGGSDTAIIFGGAAAIVVGYYVVKNR
jgi:hypothetical protein